MVVAFAGTGFGRLTTVGGAFQSELCAKTVVIAKANESPSALLIRLMQVMKRGARLELGCHTDASVVRRLIYRLRIFTEKISTFLRELNRGSRHGLDSKS
jgi:hypothetical protein